MSDNSLQLKNEFFTDELVEQLRGRVIGSIELFEKEHNVKVETIKVVCPNCSHSWGIKLSDYDSSLHIPKRKFVCVMCSDNF